MFNFLTKKERWLLLVGPVALVLIILFQGWQANHWHAEMVKEEQLKAKWQKAYIELNDSVKKFAEQQAELTAAVNRLNEQQHTESQELKHALKNNQNWADNPLPNDVKRVLNPAADH